MPAASGLCSSGPRPSPCPVTSESLAPSRTVTFGVTSIGVTSTGLAGDATEWDASALPATGSGHGIQVMLLWLPPVSLSRSETRIPNRSDHYSVTQATRTLQGYGCLGARARTFKLAVQVADLDSPT